MGFLNFFFLPELNYQQSLYFSSLGEVRFLEHAIERRAAKLYAQNFRSKNQELVIYVCRVLSLKKKNGFRQTLLTFCSKKRSLRNFLSFEKQIIQSYDQRDKMQRFTIKGIQSAGTHTHYMPFHSLYNRNAMNTVFSQT